MSEDWMRIVAGVISGLALLALMEARYRVRWDEMKKMCVFCVGILAIVVFTVLTDASNWGLIPFFVGFFPLVWWQYHRQDSGTRDSKA